MSVQSRTYFRGIRAIPAALAAAAALNAAVLSSAPAASADTSGSRASGNQAALQLQAQELAAQIQADGRQLDQMAEAFDAATIHSQQLASQVASLRSAMAQTGAAATTARANLKAQVVLSYVVGGAPAISSVPERSGTDPSLAISYAEIVTGGQKRALDAYKALLAEQTSQSAQLVAAQRDAAVTLEQLGADRAAAVQADAARQKALSQVNGQIAVLVAQVRAQQQAAAQAAALAAQRSRPNPARTPTTSPHPTTTVARGTGNPVPTTAPAQTTTTVAKGSGGGSTSGSGGGSPAQAPGASKALAYARAQLGKPYQWAGAGPSSFDCSGLTMMAWEQAGVYFPHLAQAQYNMTTPVSLSVAIPGDLIFFGTPSNVYHVGLYIGNGQMIDAPETGQNVSIQSIYWSDLLGAGRVTG